MNYIIELIKQKLAQALSARIAYYYIGDPEKIPAEVLEKGCILISPDSQTTELLDTQMDTNVYEVTITVLKDMKQDYNKQPQEVISAGWLMDIVDGRTSDGSLKSDTIRSTMRKSLTEIGQTHILSIEYGTSQRDEVSARAAVVKVRLTDMTARPR